MPHYGFDEIKSVKMIAKKWSKIIKDSCIRSKRTRKENKDEAKLWKVSHCASFSRSA